MITEVRGLIIPAINSFCGVPVIEADQEGDALTGLYVLYKFTTARMNDVGRSDDVYDNGTLKSIEQYKMVISINAIGDDLDQSEGLANQIYEWFSFHGSDLLEDNNIAVVDMTSIQNRDTFLIDEYERRNGFDVTIRVTKEISRTVDYIETVVSNNQTIDVDGKVIINGTFTIS